MASRQRQLGHVMVDDDQVEPDAPGLGQRLEGGDAAIDGDHDRGALSLSFSSAGVLGP